MASTAVGGHIARPDIRTIEWTSSPGIRAAGRTAWSWISLVMVASAVCALTMELMDHPVAAPPRGFGASSPPASLYFGTGHAATDSANRAVIASLASAAKNSLMPVVVAGYADRAGNRDKNLRLVQKQAKAVRDALITQGVPTLRIVVASPSFAAVGDARRVEVALARGVRAFPTEPSAATTSLAATQRELR